MSHHLRAIALLASLALASVSHAQGSAARAEPTEPAAAAKITTKRADELFEEGKAKLMEQDYAAACPLLAGSFALDPATGTQLALALCYERAGETTRAIAEYRAAAARAKEEGQSDREQAATRRADELEDSLKPKAAPAPLPKPKPLREPVQERVYEDYDEEPRSGGLSTGQWIGIGTGSAGVIALGVASGFAIHAASLESDSKPGCDGDLCTEDARQKRLDAVSAGNVASLMALTGAVLVVTGATIFFSTGGEQEDSYALVPWVSPSAAGATASARF